jgi:hypothetical protein
LAGRIFFGQIADFLTRNILPIHVEEKLMGIHTNEKIKKLTDIHQILAEP